MRARLWLGVCVFSVGSARVLIQRVQLRAFRALIDVEVALQPGINFLVGDNGSGKTSVLEALHLLAHGRSFRGRVRDGLVRNGDPSLSVYAEWEALPGSRHRAGLQHSGHTWKARLDGADVAQLGELCEAAAVVTFEPGSHALVDGASEHRRRYLDWGVFHTDTGFLAHWRRYARALKQRNALLRSQAPAEQLLAWELELASTGEVITALREQQVILLQQALERLLPRLLPAASGIAVSLSPGWRKQELALQDALLLARARDLAAGYTSAGPHRADLRWQLNGLPGKDGLSRGQAKQLALTLLFAQAALLGEALGHLPVLQLDDLGSELDRHHQRRVLEVVSEWGGQALITGTEVPRSLSEMAQPIALFHVKHDAIQRTEPGVP